jgi:ribose 5-phosphate isomerase A
MEPMSEQDAGRLAAHALTYVRQGQVLGLGSGRAATALVQAVGRAVQSGLEVTAIPTSEATAALARSLGIRLASLDETPVIDLTLDGADEVDPRLDLIKGYGGALMREKVVAAASRRLVILVGREKRVPVLGSRGRLPVEVIPFAVGLCRRRLADAGLEPVLRAGPSGPVITDNGNVILDCGVGPIADPRSLDERLRAVPGVVCTGLFLGMAHAVLVWEGDRVTTLERR